MVPALYLVGLIIAAVSVSSLGAAFSIFGLRDLFSGAALAVAAMAAALEFAKFVLAAYLHHGWKRVNVVFRAYLTAAIVILSIITSMGIFGYLSNAYQSASATLESETIKLTALKSQLDRANKELAQINKGIDEIPARMVTKKLAARAEVAPALDSLKQTIELVASQIAQADLKILEVKQKVGPLIYISRAFNVDIDKVVKYLILVLVLVFDPLAICLVIATSEAFQTRHRKETETSNSPGAVVDTDEVIHMRFAETDKEESKKTQSAS